MNRLLRPRVWPSFLASSGVGTCDVPLRYASEPIPRYRGTSCQARGASACAGRGTPMFAVSRQQLKIPAVRLRRTGSLRNVRYLDHFIVVRSLSPSAPGGLRGMRSLKHFHEISGLAIGNTYWVIQSFRMETNEVRMINELRGEGIMMNTSRRCLYGDDCRKVNSREQVILTGKKCFQQFCHSSVASSSPPNPYLARR